MAEDGWGGSPDGHRHDVSEQLIITLQKLSENVMAGIQQKMGEVVHQMVTDMVSQNNTHAVNSVTSLLQQVDNVNDNTNTLSIDASRWGIWLIDWWCKTNVANGYTNGIPAGNFYTTC